jgi:glucose/arabinose dehydrogenase
MKRTIQVRELRLRAKRGALSFAAVCLTGVLAPIACSSELPVKKPTINGTAGAQSTQNATGGSTQAAGGSGSTSAGTTAAGASSAAGSPANPATCPECAEFGLDKRPANPTCLAGNPPPTSYKFSRIWQGVTLGTALGINPLPDGKTLIVSQKNGIARAIPIDKGATQAQTREFLNLTSIINTEVESGLLSLAVHPNFATNGFVYVVYTRNDGQHSTRVSRFKSNNGGQSLDLASETKVYEHTQVRGTHHGGDSHFGPDGYLYVSFGDNNTGDDHNDFTAQNKKAAWASKPGS